jgi:hypothetical protein
VIKAVVLKNRGFWGVTVLVVVNFPKCLPGQKMKALRSLETSGLFTETKEDHITEDLILQTFYALHNFFYFHFYEAKNFKTFKFEILKS